MIGRAAIGYPWIFREIKHYLETGAELAPPTIQERVAVCKKHLQLSLDWKGHKVGINEMRTHYTNYLKGLPNIKEYRLKLVTLSDLDQITALLDEIEKLYYGYEFDRKYEELINYHQTCPI